MAVYGALISVVEQTPSMLVGTIDEHTLIAPTTRPDGTILQDGDYIQVKSSAQCPFTIKASGQTFTINSINDVLSYSRTDGKWYLSAAKKSSTTDILVKEKDQESLSGNSTTQYAINVENVNRLKEVLETATFKLENNKLSICLTKYNGYNLICEDIEVDNRATEDSTNLIDSNAVWLEIIKKSDCVLEYKNNQLHFLLKNNKGDTLFEGNLNIDTTATEDSTNLIDSNAVWKELIDTTQNILKIENNILTLEFKNNNGTTLFTKTLNVDNTATKDSKNLIDSNAVYNELIDKTKNIFEVKDNKLLLKTTNNKNVDLIDKSIEVDESATAGNTTHLISSDAVSKIKIDNVNSVFELDTTTASDKINLQLKDGEGNEILNKTIDFEDNIVLRTKEQQLLNKSAVDFNESGTSTAENINISNNLEVKNSTTLKDVVVNNKIEVPDIESTSADNLAVNKKYVDNATISNDNSSFTWEADEYEDHLKLVIKDKNNTELLNKEINFCDKLVLKDEPQELTNKIINAEDNYLDLFEEVANLPTEEAKKCLYYDTTNKEVKFTLDGGTTWQSLGGDAFERVTELPTSNIKNHFYLLDVQAILLGSYNVKNPSVATITDKGLVLDDVLYSNYQIANNLEDNLKYLQEDENGELKVYTYSYDTNKTEVTTQDLNASNGMYYYHPRTLTWIKIGEANVDDTTIEYNTEEKLQVKDAGITLNKINESCYDNEATKDSDKLLKSGDIFNELIDTTKNTLEINNEAKLALKFVNNKEQEVFNKTLDIDTTATEASNNLINSNAVWKEILNNDNSTFEYDTTTTDNDKLKLTIKNGNNEEKINKTIEFNDNIVLRQKEQELKNKTIDADNNTIKNIETDNFKEEVIRTSLLGFQETPDDTHIVSEKLIKDKIDERIAHYSTLPEATEHVGEIVQYIGETTEELTNGYFYKATEGAWKKIDVQEGGSGVIVVEELPTEDIKETSIYRKENEFYNYDKTNTKWNSFTQTLKTDTGFNKNSKIWKGTKEEYTAIETKDDNTLYFITDDGELSVDGIPIGSIISFGGAEAPVGWLICNGLAVSRTDYKNLFEVIGTTYGAGDGSTTFNLPNLQNRFPEGAGTNALGTYLSSALPSLPSFSTASAGAHTHTVNGSRTTGYYVPNGSYYGKDETSVQTTSSNGSHTHTINVGSSSIYGQSSVVQPEAVVVNYIIKFK